MTNKGGQILDFNAALTEKELATYLSSDEYDPDRKAKVLSGLNSSVESFVAWLFPAAIVTPRNAKIGNVHGSPGTSLVIETRGGKKGVWSDFADPDQKGGNLIDLYMAARGVPFKAALDELAEWVGHGTRPEVNYQREQAAKKLKRFDRDLGPQKGEWHYTDAEGQIIATVYRFEPEGGGKEFLPWDALKRRYGNPDVRPLYNLPEVLRSPSVVLCEGEKAADALIAQGICATAVMGGSNSPLDRTDLTPLQGKELTIWPDADEPGRKFALAFAQAVESIAATVRIIEPPEGVERGWDAADCDDPGTVLGMASTATAEGLAKMSGSPFQPRSFSAQSLDSIPPRRWLMGSRLQRGKATGGVAPGGVGKSSFSLATAIAIALGDSRLTGETVHESGAALVIYNEEDYDELHRRIAAICKFWQIDPKRLEGRLFELCSVSGELKVVRLDKNGASVVMPEVGLMVDYCKARGIVYLCCDPFITFHNVPENDNTNIDVAARQFSRIADQANLAVDLLHHISKGDGDSEGHAGDITRARGAAALGAAVRNSYTLAAMSEKTATKLNIKEDYVRFVRMDDGKRNYSLRSGGTAWFYLESVTIANGDSVGVIRPHDFSEIEQAKSERQAEQTNLEKEEMLAAISGMMATPEMPIRQLAYMVGGAYGKTDRWGRTAIQSVIPPHPARIEMHDCSLWLERRGTSATAPLVVIREAKP
jgi:hypothetical protein